jgi:hypothetical protein
VSPSSSGRGPGGFGLSSHGGEKVVRTPRVVRRRTRTNGVYQLYLGRRRPQRNTDDRPNRGGQAISRGRDPVRGGTQGRTSP